MDHIDGARLTQQHVAPLLESADTVLQQAALEIITSREGWSDQIIAFLDDWLGSDGLDTQRAQIAFCVGNAVFY